MSDSPSRPDSPPNDAQRRSPTQPTRPPELVAAANASAPATGDTAAPAPRPERPTSPETTLRQLRAKQQQVANEYAAGNISRAQFNAIYAHYDEQRTLVEMLQARNPNNPAWRQAAAPGHTSFLRSHFEAHALNFAIYLRGENRALMGGGKVRPDLARIGQLLQMMARPENQTRVGVARLALSGAQWLVIALGEHAVTFVTFNLEPAKAQATRVLDLHNDFERANRSLLRRGRAQREMLVYPQRALLEKTL